MLTLDKYELSDVTITIRDYLLSIKNCHGKQNKLKISLEMYDYISDNFQFILDHPSFGNTMMKKTAELIIKDNCPEFLKYYDEFKICLDVDENLDKQIDALRNNPVVVIRKRKRPAEPNQQNKRIYFTRSREKLGLIEEL
jgi:hypothetical protein